MKNSGAISLIGGYGGEDVNFSVDANCGFCDSVEAYTSD